MTESIQPSKTEAKERAAKLVELDRNFSRAWAELARQLDMCLLKRDPETLGLSFPEYVAKFCKRSASDARRKVLISRGLAGLPDKELSLLPEGNAHKLLRLPETVRTRKEWLDKAQDMPVEAFAEAVERFLDKKQGITEDFHAWRLIAPQIVCNLLDEATEKLARSFGLDTELKPGSRFMAWERLAAWIMNTDPEELLNLIEGGK